MDLSEGKMFHTVTYGQNMMGSHASQLNHTERWMIISYIKALQAASLAAEESEDAGAEAAESNEEEAEVVPEEAEAVEEPESNDKSTEAEAKDDEGIE